jgi:hypothetical protein
MGRDRYKDFYNQLSSEVLRLFKWLNKFIFLIKSNTF